MWKLLGLAVAGLALYILYANAASLRRNIHLARASGIPYRVVPVGHTTIGWLLVGDPIVRLLERTLPEAWQGRWLADIHPMQTWVRRYRLFADLGSDIVMLVSPQCNWLYVADAEAIAQIVQRRNDFVKPTHYYAGLDLYGKNVITAEGQFWRHHRRIVAPSFNEHNNHMVWDESLHQAQNLMAGWTGVDGTDESVVPSLGTDAMRLSLYVISKAGFGRSMKWPGAEEEDVRATPEPGEEKAAKGESRSMTYTRTLDTLIRNILVLMALPVRLLRVAPVKKLHEAAAAHDEFGRQMGAMYAKKEKDMRETSSAGTDLMGGLIKAAGTTKGQPLLSREEVMGNAFVMLVAGHETTANSIHFSLILLAMHIDTQRRVQAEIDHIVGDRAPARWSYENDLPRLFNGLLGAVMAEQLRLIPPIIDIPKWNTTPQTLTVGDKRYSIPAYTRIGLSAVAVQRNPKNWPHGPPRNVAEPEHPLSNLDNDLEEFKPDRWLTEGSRIVSPRASPKSSPCLAPTDRHESPHAPPSQNQRAQQSQMNRESTPSATPRHLRSDTSRTDSARSDTESLPDLDASLQPISDQPPSGHFKPAKGAYLPFSEGYRSCLGRRFAQVEFIAVMATILQHWTVELVVDESDFDGGKAESVSSGVASKTTTADRERRKQAWQAARRRARDCLNNQMTTLVTMQLKTGVEVSVRFVRRGCERFGPECEVE